MVFRVAGFDPGRHSQFPELVTVGNPRHLDFSQPQLWVALPTFLFALKTKSLGGTVVVGMMLFWIVGKLL
jgi:branched-subunit amino acid transport protein